MEGAPHTAKRTIDVPLGCPPPLYIKERRRKLARGRAPWGGVLLGVGFAPPFPFFHRREKEGEGEGKGMLPPPLVQFGLPWGARSPLAALLSLH